jgi:hypothetical protein
MIDVDRLRERLRERVTEPTSHRRIYCENCQAEVTQTDMDNDRTCSQCLQPIFDDESVDEHLFDD